LPYFSWRCGIILGFFLGAIGPIPRLQSLQSIESRDLEVSVVVKPSQALALHRRAIRQLVEQNRARNPRIFGPVLHGRDTEVSDLDVLVDPIPGTTLLHLGGLQVKLEELLGVQVDLLTPGDLPRPARDRVLSEAIPI
jgi:uncharacterized protein